METKRISRICRVMGYGMTYPLHVIADDNKDYILKTKVKTFVSDDDYIASHKELFAEILSYIYLNFLHFAHIPHFCLLNVDDETLKLAEKFKTNGIEREQRAYANLAVSKGLNLGVELKQNVAKADLDKISQTLKQAIINYDARLMNTDRSKENPNILQDYNGNFWVIDFGLALNMGFIFDDLQLDEVFNKCYFDESYLFNDIERKNIECLQEKAGYEELEKMIQKACDCLKETINEQHCLAQIIAKREQSERIFCA